MYHIPHSLVWLCPLFPVAHRYCLLDVGVGDAPSRYLFCFASITTIWSFSTFGVCKLSSGYCWFDPLNVLACARGVIYV